MPGSHWACPNSRPQRAARSAIAAKSGGPWSDLYRFYRQAAPMLTLVHRDREALPEWVQRAVEDENAYYRTMLLQRLPVPARDRRRARAAVGHAVSFTTWYSLCIGG